MKKNILIIDSKKNNTQFLKDIWAYKELFFFLSWRDILIRYKQTVIGILWSILRPLLTMIVFTIVFGKIARLPSNNIPYPILVFSAILPWQFFANSLSESSSSLITNANLISKIFFPRIIIPISSIIVSLIDFFISFFILIILMIFYRFIPSINILFIPFFLLIAIVFSTGCGLFISSLNIKYRDFRYVIPFIIQFGLYISPVGFNSSVIPEKWILLYSLNPMVGVIEGFRWCINGKSALNINILLLSIIISIIIFIIGLLYFKKNEAIFADII